MTKKPHQSTVHQVNQDNQTHPNRRVQVDQKSALVSVGWLSENLNSPGLRVLDASWYLPTSTRKPHAEYLESHIPGALFFDIETICESDSSLPNTFPSPETFSRKIGKLGISHKDTIVIYDFEGIHSSPRAWWMFRQFGQRHVYVLNGGMHAWKNAGLPTESGPVNLLACHYEAAEPRQLCDKNFVHQHLGKRQIVDARSRERFMGTVAEPRPGLISGHIPQSISLPSSMLTDSLTRTFKSVDQIKDVFSQVGVQVSQPIICTCGSGVGACVVLLALHEIGHREALLYDGSWTEWASDPDMPVVTM